MRAARAGRGDRADRHGEQHHAAAARFGAGRRVQRRTSPETPGGVRHPAAPDRQPGQCAGQGLPGGAAARRRAGGPGAAGRGGQLLDGAGGVRAGGQHRGHAARHRPDRDGGDRRALRLRRDGAGRVGRRGGRGGDAGDCTGAGRREAPQRPGVPDDGRRGGRRARRRGVRQGAPARRQGRRAAQLGGARGQRAVADVRDVAGQRRAGRDVRRRRAVPARRLHDGRALPAAAEQHRLHADDRGRVHRHELRLHPGVLALPHGRRLPRPSRPGQPPAPRLEHAGLGARVRRRRPAGAGRRARRHLLPALRSHDHLPGRAGVAAGRAGAGRGGRAGRGGVAPPGGGAGADDRRGGLRGGAGRAGRRARAGDVGGAGGAAARLLRDGRTAAPARRVPRGRRGAGRGGGARVVPPAAAQGGAHRAGRRGAGVAGGAGGGVRAGRAGGVIHVRAACAARRAGVPGRAPAARRRPSYGGRAGGRGDGRAVRVGGVAARAGADGVRRDGAGARRGERGGAGAVRADRAAGGRAVAAGAGAAGRQAGGVFVVRVATYVHAVARGRRGSWDCRRPVAAGGRPWRSGCRWARRRSRSRWCPPVWRWTPSTRPIRVGRTWRT
uniref:Uncharacterized protein n=1 Tax=Nonomuraea gerenzanensis TaxID=93944 RepID=A0A1M4DW02_9ACTN|nr:hypothetical protein BN4615_P249 [Nonomuraea gerenzanensis]